MPSQARRHAGATQSALPAQGSQVAPHVTPAHAGSGASAQPTTGAVTLGAEGSHWTGGAHGMASTQVLPRSQVPVAARVGQAAPGGQARVNVHASPHLFPSQGAGAGAGQVKVPAVRHAPAASQASAATVGHGFASPHTLQESPHLFPSQGAGAGAEQVKVPVGTHAPDRSQAFTTAVSPQLVSPGAQTVQVSPQAFAAQGTYAAFGVVSVPQPLPCGDAAATARSAIPTRTRRMAETPCEHGYARLQRKVNRRSVQRGGGARGVAPGRGRTRRRTCGRAARRPSSPRRGGV